MEKESISFNPDEHQKVEGGGFVKKEAAEKFDEAGKLAEIAKTLKEKEGIKDEKDVTAQDVLHKEALEEETERERLFDMVKNVETSDEWEKLGEDVHNELFSNEDLLLELIKRNPKIVEFCPEKFEDNIPFIIKALRKNGRALEHIPENLKNNREIVLTAVRQDGLALQYASKELRGNKEVAINAVRNDGYAITSVSEELKNNLDVILEAINENHSALNLVSDDIRKKIEGLLK